MTKLQAAISRANRGKAWDYFYKNGNIPANDTKHYVMHHKDSTLLHTNVERYIQWNIDDLEVITTSEHASKHRKNTVWINNGYKAFQYDDSNPLPPGYKYGYLKLSERKH